MTGGWCGRAWSPSGVVCRSPQPTDLLSAIFQLGSARRGHNTVSALSVSQPAFRLVVAVNETK